jgi:hypothetical protein
MAVGRAFTGPPGGGGIGPSKSKSQVTSHKDAERNEFLCVSVARGCDRCYEQQAGPQQLLC